MSANALCQQLTELNFTSSADLRQILHQDKHTRIEGLCSELAFDEEIVRGNLEPATGNFWFTPCGSRRYRVTRILATADQQLHDLDYQLLDGFASVGMPVRLVYFDPVRREFKEIAHKKGQRHPSSLHGTGIVLQPQGGSLIAAAKERNEDRLRKACDYIEARDQLYQMAVHRLFANRWLPGGSGVWDVDAFIRSRQGRVVALEIKHKTPTAKGTFGLNDGQHNLFSFLSGYGISVVHVILEKPAGGKDIPAIDLLTDPAHIRGARWLYTRFVAGKYAQAAHAAPAHTSIYGAVELNYRHIPAAQFGLLKKLGEPATDIREKLLAGLD